MTSNYNEKWYEQLNNTDVGGDKKNDLKDIQLKEIAKEILNSEDVRKRPPELFNKLVDDIIELLRQKDIDENKLRQTLKDKQIELFKDIKAKSVKNADDRGIIGRLSNLYSEYEAKTFIEDQEKKNNFYILDYDINSGNHVKKVSDFEIELRHKNLANINTVGLCNYLIYLNKYGLLESFFTKLSDKNRDLLLSIIYLDSKNQYTGKYSFMSQLKEQSQSGIVTKLVELSKFEISNKKLTPKTIDYIINVFSGRINVSRVEQFKEDINKSEGVEQILECLNRYNTNPTPAEITNIFQEIGENYDKAIEKHTEKQKEIVILARNGRGFSENSKLEDLIATDNRGKLPKALITKSIKDLSEQDWELLDKMSIGGLVSETVGKLLVQTREKKKIQTNSKSAKLIVFNNDTNSLACATASCKVGFETNIGLFKDNISSHISTDRELESNSGEFLALIKNCPLFENINSLEDINNPTSIALLYNYFKNKSNKDSLEQRLENYLKKKIKIDKKAQLGVKYIETKDKNYEIENQIQDEFLSIIQSIPGYSGVTHIGDIMYDKYALNRAISYLNKIKNKSKQQKEVLEKLKKFRTNLGEMNKLEKTVLKNDFGILLNDSKKNNNIVSQQYIATNNSFELSSIIGQDANYRTDFFNAFFRYLDENGNEVKSLKSPAGIEFEVRKDGEGTYEIKYEGHEPMRGLRQEEARNAVSFAIFLEPMGLVDLIPYSSRIIREINLKSNGNKINDLDGLNEKEKNLILTKLGQTIIPGFQVKPELEKNKEQFTNLDIINNNLKQEKKTQDYGKITSLSQLLRLQFPTSSKDSFDIKSLLKAIPN